MSSRAHRPQGRGARGAHQPNPRREDGTSDLRQKSRRRTTAAMTRDRKSGRDKRSGSGGNAVAVARLSCVVFPRIDVAGTSGVRAFAPTPVLRMRAWPR